MLDSKDRSPELAEFVIQGVTKDGQVFRPGNWADRLSDMLSTPGKDGRIVYSSYLRPMSIQGVNGVVVRFSLEKADKHAFDLVRLCNHEADVRWTRFRLLGKTPQDRIDWSLEPLIELFFLLQIESLGIRIDAQVHHRVHEYKQMSRLTQCLSEFFDATRC